MDPDADFRPSRSRGGGGGGGLSSTSSQSHRDVSQQEALPNSSRRAANRRAARSGGDGRGGPSASSSDHHRDQQQQQQQYRHQRKSSSRGKVGDNRSVASSSHYSTAAASSAKAEGGGGRDGRRRRGGGGGGGGDEESGNSRAVCSSGGRKQGNSDDADGRKNQHRPSSSRSRSGDGNGHRHNRRDRSEEELADADADADDESYAWHDREEGSDEGGSYAEDEPDAGFERIEEEDASGRAAEESESARPLKTTTASSRARRRRSSTATDSDSTTGEGGRPTPRREEVCGEGGGSDERGDRYKDPGASATGGGGGGGGGVHGGSGSGGSSLREDLEELRRLGDASPSSGSRALTASGNASPSSSSSRRRTSPSDPPTSRGRGDRPATPPRGVDPRFDEVGSLMSRLDAPPSLAGPERNADRRGGNEGSRSRARARPPYSNYALDEEGVRQYALSHRLPPPAAPDVAEDGGDDVASRRSARGVDPPEAGRGGDPTQIGSADPPETARGNRNAYRHSSSSSSSSGKNRKNGRGGRGRREDAPASSSSGRRRGNDNSNSNSNKGGKRNNGKEEPRSRPKSPEIKGILKKKGGHIPITQFGRPVTADDAVDDGPPPPVTSDVDEEDDEHYDSVDDSGGGSDPEVTEEKSRAADWDDGTIRSHETSASASTHGTSSSARSGLRSGKYASLNAAAARKRDGDGNGDDGGDARWNRARDDRLAPVDEDGANDDGRESRRSDLESDDGTRSGSRYAAGGRHINDADSDDDAGSDDDDDTLRSIKSSADDRYDRSRSHFVRTADLGMTQDTIFAEQFLDDPNARPEPHYHHPSPHPPPGVQFHIDENWVCLDDGKGSYSPIAPQAVDALVAMGYRAACDPMMWTPTSKTRKYMTEKGLRFDDVPIPGPLDEGEGGPGDSTCLVWSGKFAHKYHGHEQPAVRSQGIVNMSPEELVDLLMDSGRVSEYNKSSIGRTDEVVLCDGTDPDNCPFSGQRKKKLTGVVMQGAKVIDGNAVFDSETDDEQSEHEEIEELVVFDDDGGKSVHTVTTLTKRERRRTNYLGVTKLVRTTNKPPFVRKVLEFFTLLHCRALTDDQGGDGYIIVGRGITPAASATEKKGKGVMHSEILLNVHIIRRLRGTKSRRDNGRGKGSRSSKNVTTSGRKASKGDLANRCLMINVNHLKSPMVPNMLAKKVGLSAALNFIADIRGLTE